MCACTPLCVCVCVCVYTSVCVCVCVCVCSPDLHGRVFARGESNVCGSGGSRVILDNELDLNATLTRRDLRGSKQVKQLASATGRMVPKTDTRTHSLQCPCLPSPTHFKKCAINHTHLKRHCNCVVLHKRSQARSNRGSSAAVLIRLLLGALLALLVLLFLLLLLAVVLSSAAPRSSERGGKRRPKACGPQHRRRNKKQKQKK